MLLHISWKFGSMPGTMPASSLRLAPAGPSAAAGKIACQLDLGHSGGVAKNMSQGALEGGW